VKDKSSQSGQAGRNARPTPRPALTA